MAGRPGIRWEAGLSRGPLDPRLKGPPKCECVSCLPCAAKLGVKSKPWHRGWAAVAGPLKCFWGV